MLNRVKFEKVWDKGKLVGFRVAFVKQIAVMISGYQLTLEYDSKPNRYWKPHYNPFAFYSLSRDVFKYICQDWACDKSSRSPVCAVKLRDWMEKKQGKLNGRTLHQHWIELLEAMDQKWLAVAKALFHANFTARKEAGSDFLSEAYNHRTGKAYGRGNYTDYGLKDICKYRAAAMLAHQRPGYFNDDWMLFYAYKGNKKRAINKTLMHIPPAIPWYILRNLNAVDLHRPLLSKAELVATLFTQGHNQRHTETVMGADKDKLKESFSMLGGRHIGSGGVSLRKTTSITDAVSYITDYPDNYEGRLRGLTNQSIEYHVELARNPRRRAYHRIWNDSREIYTDDKETAKPPIDLPESEDGTIRFLDTVGSLQEEGEKMHHCLGGYARKAVDGKNYFFHVDYAGERASIQVNDKGFVTQARGPCNCLNKATEWGKKILGEWSKGLMPDGKPTGIDFELARIQGG